MKLFGLHISRKATDLTLDELLERLEAAYATESGVTVTPENCVQAPTVQAIVTAVSRRIAVSPVMVIEKKASNGRDIKQPLPNHPVSKLLREPNKRQTRLNYFLDATSWLLRYGNFYAFKQRGSTGPIRALLPLHPGQTTIRTPGTRDETLTYQTGTDVLEAADVHHVRLAARDGITGDSPVIDVRESIALEIAAEKFGATFFGNGAVPLMVFKFAATSAGFKTDADRIRFIEDFQAKFSSSRRHRALLLPRGVERDGEVAIANDKAQFLETRKYQRTVIAGAFNVPPHLVGDLERATFNNVEQQDTDFVVNVVLPFAQAFEQAMERDLLTPEDRAAGRIIRFNLDAVQRADFKSRQEGNRIMREGGALSANEWRERENMNPVPAGNGGDDYITPLNFGTAGAPPPAPPAPPADPADTPDTDEDTEE